MIYYADEDQAEQAVSELLELLGEHDAVGLFHLDRSVHDEAFYQSFRELFDGVIELDEDGSVSSSL
jgi:hypothetical protein